MGGERARTQSSVEDAQSEPDLPRRRTAVSGVLGAPVLCALLLLIAVHPVAHSQADATGAVQSTEPPTAAPSLPQITVQAQRQAIESRVHSFVYDSLDFENDEGTARWNSPVCPEVVGLARDQGEFVLERLSQIAQAAGVPLAGAGCSPANLVVFATANPASFLKTWSQARHQRMFGDASSNTIRAFIETPRPVRVWYNTAQGPAPDVSQQDLHMLAGELGGLTDTHATAYEGPSGDSRVIRRAVWSLQSAFLVVDDTQLKGVKIGQLADYVGMCGFAQLRPGAPQRDAPTILGLFQNDASRSTPGMTPWDEAFLEALYHTNPALVRQRGVMVSRMMSHIARESAP